MSRYLPATLLMIGLNAAIAADVATALPPEPGASGVSATSHAATGAPLRLLATATSTRADSVMNLPLRPLATGPSTTLQAVLDHRPAVVLFWRSDCEPCLDELQNFRALERAAHPVPVVPIGLESSQNLRSRLERSGFTVKSWQTDVDPAEVLTRFGSNPPRLPLSVMLDSHGRLCARRIGTLGPALITEWLARCNTQLPEGAAP